LQYFGGKSRIANHIVQYLESIREPDQPYIEPFVGSGIVISKMSGKREAYDKHPYLIAMYKALQKGWIPPKEIAEEQYHYIKENKDEQPHLTGFVGFSCSFSGKWFGGFARNNRGDNYCLQSHNSLLKKMQTLHSVKFEMVDYKDLQPKNSLIYCDPPYRGTTQYGLVGNFNSDEFWNTMREWSIHNTVVIIEYNAPDDFECVWQQEARTGIRNKDNIREKRVEKLYTYKSS
jgi:DNA adenine methylase